MQVMRMLTGMDPKVLMMGGGITALGALLVGWQTSALIFLIMLVCIAMLSFAAYLAQWVLAKDEGTAEMQEVRHPRPPRCHLERQMQCAQLTPRMPSVAQPSVTPPCAATSAAPSQKPPMVLTESAGPG
jgi:hypothetical protein